MIENGLNENLRRLGLTSSCAVLSDAVKGGCSSEDFADGGFRIGALVLFGGEAVLTGGGWLAEEAAEEAIGD